MTIAIAWYSSLIVQHCTMSIQSCTIYTISNTTSIPEHGEYMETLESLVEKLLVVTEKKEMVERLIASMGAE